MLDVVPPQQDQLALPVEIVDIDDAQPRLARSGSLPIGALHGDAAAHQAAQNQDDQREDGENDDEENRELDG